MSTKTVYRVTLILNIRSASKIVIRIIIIIYFVSTNSYNFRNWSENSTFERE